MKSNVTYPTEKDLILSGNWPLYPFLPMIRRHGLSASLEDVEYGILVAGRWNMIYKANIMQLALAHPGAKTLKVFLDGLAVEVYADLDAVLESGWHGD